MLWKDPRTRQHETNNRRAISTVWIHDTINPSKLNYEIEIIASTWSSEWFIM